MKRIASTKIQLLYR